MNQKLNFYLNNMLILLGFILTFLYGYGHFIDGDVIQILDKAHVLVTQNHLIPYGNQSSSGASGNIPGAFLTLSTGLPMKLWFSPWAALSFLGFLHFLSFLMFYDVFRKTFAPLALTSVIVLYWLNPWRMSEVFLWNPGYIFFATCLHMWSAFKLSAKPSFLFSVLHGLSLFLGLQIHPSFVILGLMTLMLLWMKALKPHLLGTLTGIVLGVLSLVPYIMEGLEDPSIFPQPGSGDGKGYLFFGLINVYPLLKGFWYWILFGSNIFQTHIFHKLTFNWLGNENLAFLVKYLWTAIKYLVGAFGVGLSFYVNYLFYKKNKEKINIFKFKMTTPQQWYAIYPITAFLSAIVATAIAPTLPIYWHLLYVWPMALFPLLLKMNDWVRNEKLFLKCSRYILVLILYFSIFNLLGALGSKKHDIGISFDSLYFKACQERCEMNNL